MGELGLVGRDALRRLAFEDEIKVWTMWEE